MKEFTNYILLEGRLMLASKPELRKNIFWQHWLQESQGIPSQVEALTKAIVNCRTVNWILQDYSGEKSSMIFDLYPLVRKLEGNFLGPKSFLRVTVSPEQSREGAFYSAKKVAYNKETDQLDGVEIQAQVFGRRNKELTRNVLQSILAHELTHVYEDFSRRRAGKESLTASLKARNYSGVEDPENQMEWFCYLMDPAEQRANIAETVDNIKQLIQVARKAGKLDSLSGIRSIEKLIDMTEIGPTYREIRSWIESTQWDRMPKFRQEVFIDEYERISGNRVPYRRLVTILQETWAKFDKKLKVRISQAVVAALAEEPEQVQEEKKLPIIYAAY